MNTELINKAESFKSLFQIGKLDEERFKEFDRETRFELIKLGISQLKQDAIQLVEAQFELAEIHATYRIGMLARGTQIDSTMVKVLRLDRAMTQIENLRTAFIIQYGYPKFIYDEDGNATQEDVNEISGQERFANLYNPIVAKARSIVVAKMTPARKERLGVK